MTPLVSLTRSVESVLGTAHPSSLRARYALAETFFAIEDFSRASKEYAALLTLPPLPDSPGVNPDAKGIRIRWISSRYRELAARKLLPGILSPLKIPDPLRPLAPAEREEITAWMKAVRSVQDADGPMRSFLLAAAKLDYLFFDREGALRALTALASSSPSAPEGLEAASLALDTLVATGDWARTRELGAQLEALPFSSKDFTARVRTLIEGATLRSLQEGRIARGELAQAEEELSGASSQEGLLLRAEVRTRLGKLADAAGDLAEHQRNEQYRDSTRNRRLLELTWMSGDPAGLRSLLQNRAVCGEPNRNLCEVLRTLPLLEGTGGGKVSYLEAFRNTLRSAPGARALWCLIALEHPGRIPFQDRLVLLERLGQSWEKLPPRIQLHAGPILITRASAAIDSLIRMAPAIAPLKARAASIERRMRLTRDLERVVAKASTLGWDEIRQNGASSLRTLYTRLHSDLKAIQTPEALLKPVEARLAALGPDEASAVIKQNKTSAKTEPEALSDSTPESIPDPSDESLLLSKEIRASLPAALWDQWEKIAGDAGDPALNPRLKTARLLELADNLHSGASAEAVMRVLKGAILALNGAPSTGLSLMASAPDSPLKKAMIDKIRRLK